jgi:hypothetical protein
MSNKNDFIIEQDKQEILFIIEALQLYKDIAIKPKYSEMIEKQIDKIVDQLQIQGISIYKKDYESEYKIGDIINYNCEDALVIGTSNKDCFIKIAISSDKGIIEIIDVPYVLCERKY